MNHITTTPAESMVSHEEPKGGSKVAYSFTDAQYIQILQLLGQTPSTAETSANLAGNFTSLMTVNEPNSWILDSGANAHITGTSSVLQNPKPCESSTNLVILPNGNSTSIISTGSVQISASCTLQNVLLVPDFQFNLISISQFTKDQNCCVVFYPHFCVFQDL